jgi:predicted RNA-binding protein associated with RNAse of E/G family
VEHRVTPGSAETQVFELAQRDRLREFELVYHRPPGRVARIPMRVFRLDHQSLCGLTELAPKEPLRFDDEVVLDRGGWAVWFVGNGASHDLGKIYSADGRHTGYYLDVLEPARWQGDDIATLEPLTDLFLDLWVAPDGRWQVLDEPEFLESEAKQWITPEQAVHARRTLAHLVELARAGALVPPEAQAFTLRF